MLVESTGEQSATQGKEDGQTEPLTTNGSITIQGAGLINIRYEVGVFTSEDNKCPGFLDVYCKDPEYIPPPSPKSKEDDSSDTNCQRLGQR